MRSLYRLHTQASAYGFRPSQILGLETPWGAFQLDELTLMVGRRVEKNIAKKKDAFDGFALASANGKGRFRSAKPFVKRKIKIPKSGIW